MTITGVRFGSGWPVQAAQARHGGEQRAGIGMLRRGEDVAHRRLLHLLALPHHHHVVGHLGHHAHVVGDEDDGGAHLLLAGRG